MHQHEVIIPIVVFGVFYLIVKTVSDNKIRHKLIDKGLVDEKIKFLFSEKKVMENPLQSLKWGLVFIGVGLGFFIQVVFPYLSDAATIGFMFIMAGVAFIVFHVLAKKQMNNHDV